MLTKQYLLERFSEFIQFRYGRHLLLVWPLILFLTAIWVMGVSAQEEGPECPPGFVFDRLSGVGCVQEDCFSVGYYSYTGACVCLEGYIGCYEPVDYGSFDSTLCQPFCPNSTLVACIQTPEVCPSEAGTFPPFDGSGEEDDLSPFQDTTPVQQIQQILSGPTTLPPTPMRAAIGAMVATSLLGSWLVLDWLRDKELISDIWKDIKKLGASLLKPVADDVKSQVIKKAGADLAVNTADILDSLSEKPKSDNDEESKADKEPLQEKKKDLSPEKKPSAEQEATDRLVEEFLKGEKPDSGKSAKKKDDIPQAKASTPVKKDVVLVNPKSRVFEGTEAMIILKELGMLPLDTAKGEKIPITRDELDDYIGPAPDNRPRKITLPSGRTIIVTKVEAILFEGEDKAVPGGDPKQIDFKKSVVITAELVEEKSTTGAPTGQPVGSQPTGQPSGGTAPTGQQPTGQPPGKPDPIKPTVGQPPGGQTPAQPPSGTVSQAPGGTSVQPAPTGDSPGTSDQSTFPPDKVIYVDPETGEEIEMDRKTKALLEEAERLLRDGPDDKEPPPRGPSRPGHADTIDGDEASSPTEDF